MIIIIVSIFNIKKQKLKTKKKVVVKYYTAIDLQLLVK